VDAAHRRRNFKPRRWINVARSSFSSGRSFFGIVKRFPSQAHFCFMLVFVYLFGTLQAMYFAGSANPWLHLDLVSILVVYFGVEHFLFGALIRTLVGALFMQSITAAPVGFYVMYFLLALVLSNAISRFFVLHNIFSQLGIFFVIFLMKFVLLYFVMQKQGGTMEFQQFFMMNFPELAGTTLVSVPLFSFLAYVDANFEYVAFRDRRKENTPSLISH
jgi:hypothetical protein